MADLPQLLCEPGLVPGREDPVALDHEPAAHNVLTVHAFLDKHSTVVT